MANAYTNGIDQAIDSDGNVYPGARRYFYDNGTTNLRTIWQDKAKATEHANPVVADAAGMFPQIFIEGAYSTRLETSAGALIDTQDDVNVDITDILSDISSTAASLTNLDYDEASSSGLSFAYSSGRIDKLDGTVTSISASSVTLPASSTSYIYLNLRTEAVEHSTTLGQADSILIYTVITDGSSIISVTRKKDAFRPLRPFPTDHINGLVVTVGTDTDHDFDIATGQCRSSDDATDGLLASAITKQMDAEWVDGTGNGGMANGVTLSASSTYYVHALIDPTDGSMNAGGDSSATAVNLLADTDVSTAGYTKYRQLCTFDTDASGNIDSTTVVQTNNGRTDKAIEDLAEGRSSQKIKPAAVEAFDETASTGEIVLASSVIFLASGQSGIFSSNSYANRNLSFWAKIAGTYKVSLVFNLDNGLNSTTNGPEVIGYAVYTDSTLAASDATPNNVVQGDKILSAEHDVTVTAGQEISVSIDNWDESKFYKGTVFVTIASSNINLVNDRVSGGYLHQDAYTAFP